MLKTKNTGTETTAEQLLGSAISHLASDDLDLIHIQDICIVEFERGIPYAEGPDLFAQTVVFEVTLSDK